MKKKILFVINGYHIGGVNKAFLSFIHQFDFTRYDVSFFSTGDSEAWRGLLPQQIRIINLLPSKQEKLFSNLKNLLYRLRVRLSNSDIDADYWSVKTWNISDECFDFVICYNGQDIAAISAAARFCARKRLIWFHGSVSEQNPRFLALSRKLLQSFDAGISVSKALCNDVLSVYPFLYGKLSVVHNTVNAAQILQMAESPLPHSLKKTAIVTVGRLCYEKGQDLIPHTVRLLLDDGFEIYWYIIGDGQGKDLLLSEIERNCVKENVILLGAKDNPFPYMKACDIYVQPSRTEGWGLTVQEAKILRKYIVTTPLPVMYEQIINGVNGIMATQITSDAIYEVVKKLIGQTSNHQKISAGSDSSNHDGVTEHYKLYAILEDK